MAENKLKQYFDDTKQSVNELSELVSNGLQKSIDKLSSSMSGTNINTGISKYQVQAVDDLATKLSKIKEIQESLNVTYTRATSLYNNMAVGEQKLATEVTKTIKVQNSLADAIDKKAQKEAQAAAKAEQNAAKTSAAYQQELRKLEELGAQYRENYLTLGKNNSVTRDSLAAYNSTAKGLRDMNVAMGSAKSQTGNLAYQTNSLTMILSELPNAGISTRIFIMSLSNNILPLMQQFKALSMEVDQFGNTLGKMGALKTFAKSLLGINAIAMIAVTLFVTYSDEIIKWTKSLFDGADALDDLAKAQNRLNDAKNDPNGSYQKKSEELIVLSSVLKNAKKSLDDLSGAHAKNNAASTSGVNSAQLLNKAWQDITRTGTEFKKVMGSKLSNKETDFLDSLPSITKIEDKKKAVQQMQNLFNTYQNVIMNAASASDSNNKIAKEITDINLQIDNNFNKALSSTFNKERIPKNEYDKWVSDGETAYNKLKYYSQKIEDLRKKRDNTSFFNISERASYGQEAERLALENNRYFSSLNKRQIAYVNYARDNANLIKKKNDLESQLSKTSWESIYDIDTQNQKKQRQHHERTQQEMYEKEKFYSEERVKLQERNMNLSEQINKETSEGTLNTYSQRLRAEAEYYQNEKRIQQINKEESLFNTDQEYAQKLVKLSNYLKGSTNTKDKATKKELDEAKKNYTKEMANAGQNYELRKQAENNYFDAVSKIMDKGTENMTTAQKSYNKVFTTMNKNRIIENKEATDKEIQENIKLNKDYSRQLLSIIKDRISDENEANQKRYNTEDAIKEISRLEDELDRAHPKNGMFSDVFKGINQSEVDKYEKSIYDINKSLNDSQTAVSRAQDAYDTVASAFAEAQQQQLQRDISGIGTTDEEAANFIHAQEEKKKALDKLNDAILKNQKTQDEGNAKLEDANKTLLESYERMAVNTFGSSATAVMDAYYNHLFKQIEKEKKLNSKKEETALSELEDRYNAGAKAADGELLTKEKYEKEKNRITAYYQALNDNLDAKKAQKEKEQFMMDKAVAISTAIMNTALAITEALIKNPAAIPWITAIGAMQVATITAQMVMYKEGTDYHPKDSMAIVNDGQHKEVVQRPNENPVLMQGKNVPIWLPRGSKVFKSEQDYINKVGFDNVDINAIENKELMKTVSIMNVVNSSNNDYLLKDLIKEQRINNKILKEKNLSVSTSIMDKVRRDKYYKRGGYCG